MLSRKQFNHALFCLVLTNTTINNLHAMETTKNPSETALLNELKEIATFSEKALEKAYKETASKESGKVPNSSQKSLMLTTMPILHNNTKNTDSSPVQSSLMFQDINLSDEIAQSIWIMAPRQIKSLIRSMQNYETNAECLPKVIVLYGPHGSGKSKTAALIAQMTSRNLFFINTAFLGTTYMNSETTNLGEAVAQIAALNIPCVIVIDEADTLSKSKDQTNDRSAGLDAAIAQLLDTYETNQNIFFVWTTNNIGKIEEKFLDRIGDNIFKIDNPNKNCRRKILALYANAYKNTTLAKDINLAAIAKKTDEFSIRRLKDLVQEAQRLALLRPNNTIITQKDFEKAFKNKSQLRHSVDNASRKERILRHVKEHTVLYSIAVPVALAVIGTAFNYCFLHKPSLAQAERLAKKQIDVTKEEGTKNRLSTAKICAVGLTAAIFGPIVAIPVLAYVAISD